MNKKEQNKEAVVLKYDDKKHDAPVVKAKGRGFVAEKILQEEKKYHVPVYEDEALLELLEKININETIPEELFRAVAEVFAFIYLIDKQKQGD